MIKTASHCVIVPTDITPAGIEMDEARRNIYEEGKRVIRYKDGVRKSK